MEIKRLQGTEEELYRLVAPLVMNPVVLKQNYNFPFRTSERFEWFVGVNDEGQVSGFVPVERKRAENVINNYYVKGKDAEVLEALLKPVVAAYAGDWLAVVAFAEDADLFRSLGFVTEKQWTRYVRMRKEPADEKQA